MSLFTRTSAVPPARKNAPEGKRSFLFILVNQSRFFLRCRHGRPRRKKLFSVSSGNWVKTASVAGRPVKKSAGIINVGSGGPRRAERRPLICPGALKGQRNFLLQIFSLERPVDHEYCNILRVEPVTVFRSVRNLLVRVPYIPREILRITK